MMGHYFQETSHGRMEILTELIDRLRKGDVEYLIYLKKKCWWCCWSLIFYTAPVAVFMIPIKKRVSQCPSLGYTPYAFYSTEVAVSGRSSTC